MKHKRLLVAALAICAAALTAHTIRAQINGESTPQTGASGNAATTQLPCVQEGTPGASSALCITAVIPPNAVGLGAAAFGINPLYVNLGTTIIWVNQDSVAHTVTANDGSFDSGPINPGQYFAHSFNSAGTFPYYDSIYGSQSMSGSVVISPTATASLPYAVPTYGSNCPTPAYPYPNFPYPYIPPYPPGPRPTPRPSPSPSISPSPRPSPSMSSTPTPPTPSPSPSPSGLGVATP
ncbi:MAG: hypothetical protein P4M08_13555 [Oligoflexia bacterium]|nr:hypothetical protein [Oligoflexia bacterium]